MGWITRRVVGAIVFACVTAILGSYAIARGYISTEPTLSTACGALILGIAFLVSLSVTSWQKRRDVAAKNAKAWQEYYARQWAQYYQRR